MKDFYGEGCDWCMNDGLSDNIVDAGNELISTLSIIGDKLHLNIDVQGEDGHPLEWKHFFAPINYCPKCGRVLNKFEDPYFKRERIKHTIVDEVIGSSLISAVELKKMVSSKWINGDEIDSALEELIEDGCVETLIIGGEKLYSITE